jgi:hypothetical protein
MKPIQLSVALPSTYKAASATPFDLLAALIGVISNPTFRDLTAEEVASATRSVDELHRMTQRQKDTRA